MTQKHRRALHGMAIAMTASALAAPAASAVPAEQFFPRPEDESRNRSSSVSPPPSSIAASAVDEYEKLRSPHATTVPVRVVRVRADGGFDWGDAGIGATGALALTAIGIGAAFALGQGPGRRHMPQPIR
jgi:hypothetical protein